MIKMSLKRKRKRSLTVSELTTCKTGAANNNFRGGSSIADDQRGLFGPRPSISSRRSMMMALLDGKSEYCEDVFEDDSEVVGGG